MNIFKNTIRDHEVKRVTLHIFLFIISVPNVTCQKTMRFFAHSNIFDFSKNIDQCQTTFFFVEQGTSECSECYQIGTK